MKRFYSNILPFIFCLALSITSLSASDNLAAVEIVAEINEPNPDMSGIVVTGDGRMFLTFPRHADNHKLFSLAEYKNGELIPFPNKEMTYPSNKPYYQWLVSPHGMTLDADGNIWVVDDGKRAGIAGIPDGAAKVVGFNPKTNEVIATIVIKSPALRQDSHLNDLRVDLNQGEKGIVIITNSSFGTIGSLVVADIATKQTREVLADQESTNPQPDFMAFLEHEPRVYDPENVTLPSGGADGIAIVNETVYWTPITGRGLYSMPISALADFSTTEEELRSLVTYEGERPACDGLAEDKNGNIYFGAYEQMGLVKRTPEGDYKTLAIDNDRFGWLDGLFYADDGYLYVTLGQWNRLPSFNEGKDLRKRPYQVARIKVD